MATTWQERLVVRGYEDHGGLAVFRLIKVRVAVVTDERGRRLHAQGHGHQEEQVLAVLTTSELAELTAQMVADLASVAQEMDAEKRKALYHTLKEEEL